MKKTFKGFRIASGILMMTIALVFPSCDEKEEVAPPDTENPKITITSPSSTGFVQDQVSIKADITDNKGVKSAKVFIDDVEYKSIEGNLINDIWDSKLVEDGAHTIKIVATDLEGNEESASVTVNVLNYFIKFNVSAEYGSTEPSFIYITKEDGTVLGVQKVEAGKVLRFETPDDYESSQRFVYTRFSQYDFGRPYNVFATYVEFPAGSYEIVWGNALPSSGTAEITIKNIPGFYPSTYGGGKGVWPFSGQPDFETGDNHAPFVLQDEAADVFISAYSFDVGYPKYSVVENVHVDDHITIDYNDFQEYEVTHVSLPENILSSYSSVYAIPNGAPEYLFDASRHFRDMDGDEKLMYHVPGDLFDEYIFVGTASFMNGNYYHTKKASTAPTEFKINSSTLSSLSFENAQLNVSINGENNDYVYLNGVYENENAGTSWNVYLPGTATSTVKLVTPEQLVADYNLQMVEALDFGFIRFIASDSYDGYSEFLANSFTYGLWAERETESVEVSYYFENGGRKKPLTAEAVREMMEEDVKARLKR